MCKMQTYIEIEDGQSFVIGGLIDNQITESVVTPEIVKGAATSVPTNPAAGDKIPTRASIPVEELTVPEAPKHEH